MASHERLEYVKFERSFQHSVNFHAIDGGQLFLEDLPMDNAKFDSLVSGYVNY